MSHDLSDMQIVDNPEAGRWEARIGEHVAVAAYQRQGDLLIFTHTEVPPALEGQGVASRLIKTALDHARDQNMQVVPYCPFVIAYIRRHADYASLVPQQYRGVLEQPGNT